VSEVLLALYSDRLFMAAVAVYVLAMLLAVTAYALTRTAREAAGVPVAAGVGAGAGAGPVDAPGDDPGAPPAGRSRAERLAAVSVNLTVVAALLQAGSIVARGLAADRWPLGNMYEFTSAFCLAGVVCWLVAVRRSPALRVVGGFVLLPVVVLLFLAGTVLYARAAPVVPALRSYWLVVHVTTITTASGLLVVPGVASILHLALRHGRAGAWSERLPSAAALDRLAYRTTIVAFPLYTFGVIAGAIWAEAAWGRFWGWDPKETVAFVAWVVYAAYLHARATAGWRTGRAAWVNVAGLAVVLFNLFFINMVVAGLHSYAGLG
jgi:cytochrome c-type biogenesis protein CcsB